MTFPRISYWTVGGYIQGAGGYPWTWQRMSMIYRIRAWWRRHICAAAHGRILHGTAEGYIEQMREAD
jgi:hypothetical protein